MCDSLYVVKVLVEDHTVQGEEGGIAVLDLDGWSVFRSVNDNIVGQWFVGQDSEATNNISRNLEWHIGFACTGRNPFDVNNFAIVALVHAQLHCEVLEGCLFTNHGELNGWLAEVNVGSIGVVLRSNVAHIELGSIISKMNISDLIKLDRRT